jgi:hypothetical protein
VSSIAGPDMLVRRIPVNKKENIKYCGNDGGINVLNSGNNIMVM